MTLSEVLVAPYDYNHGRGLALVFEGLVWHKDLQVNLRLGSSPGQVASQLRELADQCDALPEERP